MLTIRPAIPSDVPAIFDLICALAEYEQLSHMVVGSAEALGDHLFGDRPCVEAIVAQWEQETVGFALFFSNYSTFLTKPGIYLEDLFVLLEYRRRGIAKAMLSYIAQLASDRGAGRLEWSVLDWNNPAIDFYKSIGASIMEEWRICRVTEDAISRLAKQKYKE
ncbi:MAG: GNAT family N-acetyltransferase [Hydrococcus sp. Prado102]|jgi:GNAT superfamily N-acetyltransferase|nr:GNAT family N-acetyltransferase [Hydrococcus sp. Prado102]